MIKHLARQLLSQFAPIEYSRPCDEKTIYLTFDDGPTRHSMHILDLLDKYEVKATFFILGKRIEGNADVLTEIHSRGHLIGNHSFTHQNPRQLTSKGILDDLNRCNAAIRDVISDWTDTLYRPPLGLLTIPFLRFAFHHRKQITLWSKDSEDYLASSPNQIVNTLHSVVAGDIILFHDEFPATRTALNTLIPHYQNKGFAFKPL